jgi:hypothetical protein
MRLVGFAAAVAIIPMVNAAQIIYAAKAHAVSRSLMKGVCLSLTYA